MFTYLFMNVPIGHWLLNVPIGSHWLLVPIGSPHWFPIGSHWLLARVCAGWALANLTQCAEL